MWGLLCRPGGGCRGILVLPDLAASLLWILAHVAQLAHCRGQGAHKGLCLTMASSRQ
jgi:hypothetical protein